MITLKDLTVSYGDNVIYKDFNCQFDKGVNVVLGRSGSGKTTLLNAIANLVPYTGSCAVDNVAMVFQNPSLAPVSVHHNVQMVVDSRDFAVPNQTQKQAQQSFQQWIDEVLKLAQIDHLKDKRATKLSGGEQQRVSIARAFAANRPVLLLDEPFNSLDFGIKRKLYLTLQTLLQKYDKTVVLVTHDVDEALLLADRIYLLRDRPCNLTHIADVTIPYDKRDEYSAEAIALRKQLQALLS